VGTAATLHQRDASGVSILALTHLAARAFCVLPSI
jgi:hypothetical protein